MIHVAPQMCLRNLGETSQPATQNQRQSHLETKWQVTKLQQLSFFDMSSWPPTFFLLVFFTFDTCFISSFNPFSQLDQVTQQIQSATGRFSYDHLSGQWVLQRPPGAASAAEDSADSTEDQTWSLPETLPRGRCSWSPEQTSRKIRR